MVPTQIRRWDRLLRLHDQFLSQQVGTAWTAAVHNRGFIHHLGTCTTQVLFSLVYYGGRDQRRRKMCRQTRHDAGVRLEEAFESKGSFDYEISKILDGY